MKSASELWNEYQRVGLSSNPTDYVKFFQSIQADTFKEAAGICRERERGYERNSAIVELEGRE